MIFFIRISHLVILDFGFWILDFKSPADSRRVGSNRLHSRIASRFTRPQRFAQHCDGALYALLILACALQISGFADGNSDHITLSSPSANPKSKIQNPKSELPPAMEILAQVRASLPREALLIKGQILSGGRLGKLERVCYIEMFLDFGADPAIVRYKISDAFGTPLEQMTISMTEGGETEYEYETGNPFKSASAPQPTGVIRNTDVTWNDLCLLFLWRSDGRTAREENLRGRDCYILEFPANAVLIQNRQVVWIDMQMLVLIQMEELDSDGRLQRRMIVKNIKKISDQWMIKNLEIRAYPSLHHTLIKVDEVGGRAEPGIANPDISRLGANIQANF